MPPPPKKKPPKNRKPPRDDLPQQPLDSFPPRLPEESHTAYARFCQFCELPPPRSLRLWVAEKKITTAPRWSVAYAWMQRVALFDDARRTRRIQDLDTMRREADLAAQEGDLRLRLRASQLLDEAVLTHIGNLAKDADGKVATAAIKLLYRLSSIEDTRKVATLRAARDTAIAEALADPAVIAAIAQLSPEKLAAMRAPQTPPPDEYAAEDADAGDDKPAEEGK